MSPIEIFNELLKVKIDKSTGLDDVGPQILKISAPIIYESVAHIFNLSFWTGIYPSTFKCTRVSPIHKSGNVKDMNNYWPISVLPILSDFLKDYLLSNLQFFSPQSNATRGC